MFGGGAKSRVEGAQRRHQQDARVNTYGVYVCGFGLPSQ